MAKTLELLQHALAERYRIERELGRGGMATVFLAEDLKHRRRVAIKVLDPEVAAAIGPERFLREIETVAKLSHPHILPLHDSGEANGLLFYVMPFVAGESLRDRLTRAQQLPLEEALRLTREVAAALEHAHRQGVVHRDIKPENILLQEGQALVADFGIARAVDAAGVKRLTTSAVMLGTPAYMSPEQAAGGAVDARADLYGLGCVLYELLAGQAPYTGPTAESVIFQHLNAAPPHVTAMRPAVPAGLDRVIVKAMAKAPADRYATTAEFVAALEAGLTEEAERPGAKRRAVWSAVIIAVPVLALVAIAAWQAWWPFGGAGGPPPAKKDWILVAEFDGPPGDSTLAPAARSLLSAALDQSQRVATVSRDQIVQALQMAGKPPDTRVDAVVAKELAYRSAVRTVLEGTIGRLGTGYSIVLRLMDADTARVLFTESATAKSDDALIPAMGELAKKLRRGLGENRQALRATRPMTEAATPSFDAYRFYVRAQDLSFRGDFRGALTLYQEALALDPDFAMARWKMSDSYFFFWCPDSFRLCIDEALRRPQRLARRQRLWIESQRLWTDRNYTGAMAMVEQILREDPSNLEVLLGSGNILWGSGRFDLALPWLRRAMEVSPIGVTDEMRATESSILLMSGRLDEAWRLRDSNRGPYGRIWPALAYLTVDRYASAESVVTALRGDPEIGAVFPTFVPEQFTVVRAARGTVSDVARLREEMQAIYRSRPDFYVAEGIPIFRNNDSRFLSALAELSRRAVPIPPEAWTSDSVVMSLITRGLRHTVAGDRIAAQGLLDEVMSRPARERRWEGLSPMFLEARIAALSGRPEQVIQLLRAHSMYEVSSGPQTALLDVGWYFWTLADAYERSGLPDSAAACLEPIVSFPSVCNWQRPYIHQRLAMLYVGMGRVAEAERHLAAVEQAWDRPDPPIRRLLEEARTAVRGARGMARPERGSPAAPRRGS